jgi:Spy/CpxP family protein refolding chaperone
MNKIALIAFAALAASSTVALAHSNDVRQNEQADWIEQGRNNGTITWSEGIKLRREQREIARIESSMKDDGRLSRDERHTLHKLQDNAQNDIVREASDGWHRPWWLPRFGR